MTQAEIEREVKLSFDTAQDARAAILAAGATPLRCRRLQEDALLDTDDDSLRRRRCVLRVRTDSGKSLLTFKGPVQAGPMKVREELETVVADGDVLRRILEQLGLHVWFRYEKYREEFAAEDVTIALDETPVGTFVEIEGGEAGILAFTAAMGRSADDFILDSYRGLFVRLRDEHGLTGSDMVFEEA
ncbi:MAG: class IV adenylate cyclase [Acidobacteria bacterium]|nr:class IV adenylate cyclase [Acidobacteriota bacterium]